jgi:hypothetical protein
LPAADVGQQHKTLGGLELLASQGLQRLKPDLAMMEMMGIRRIANRAFLMTRQYMSLPQTIELVASESQLKQYNLSRIYKMQPYQLIGGVNFFCTGLSESIDKMQNIDKALKFMDILQKTTPGNPFIQFLTKKIALWLGFEDAEQFAETIPPTPFPPAGSPSTIAPPVPPGLPMPMRPSMAPGSPGAPPGLPVMPPRSPMVPPAQGLPPQLLNLIAQRMMMARQGMPLPGARPV